METIEIAVAAELMDHRQQLLGFVRSKLDDPDLAEDVLQDSLLKALRGASALRERDKLLPWFYVILNNAITEVYRRRQSADRTLQRFGYDLLGEGEDAAEMRRLCDCFRPLLPTLKPEYADLIDALELKGGDPAQVAAQLGITPNNLKVRRHRARQALRKRLEESCRLCAEHGCLDCTCSTNPS